MSESRKMICPKCGAENYSWRNRCQTCNTLLHEDEDMNIVDFRRQDPLRLIALFFGAIGAGVVAFFLWLVFAFALGRITDLTCWLIVIGAGLLALGSVVVARRWPLIGGILLIVEGLGPMGLSVWSYIQARSGFNFLGVLFFFIPGLPLLASGVLFLFLWREFKDIQ